VLQNDACPLGPTTRIAHTRMERRTLCILCVARRVQDIVIVKHRFARFESDLDGAWHVEGV